MDSKGLKLGLTGVKMVVSVIGVILCLLIMLNSDSNQSVQEALATHDGNLNGSLWLVYIVGVACAAAMVIFGVVHFLSDPKKNMGALIGVVALVLVLIIGYAIADDTVLRAYGEGISEGTSKWVGGGLIGFYVIGIGAIAAIIFAEIGRLFK